MSIAYIRDVRCDDDRGTPTISYRAECKACGRWASLPMRDARDPDIDDLVHVKRRLRRRLARRGCAHAGELAATLWA